MKAKTKTPSGIILLIILWSIAAFFNLIGVASQQMQISGLQINGIAGSFLHLAYLAILIFMIIGVKKQNYNAWMLSIFWTGYMIVSGILAIIFPAKLPAEFSGFNVGNMFTVFGICGIVLEGIVLWYLLKKQSLFRTGKDTALKIDKLFIIAYITALVVLMIIIIIEAVIMAGKYTKDFAAQSEQLAQAINNDNFKQALEICRQKPESFKDTCLITLLMLSKNQTGTQAAEICNEASSDLYKGQCVQMAAIKTNDPIVCSSLPEGNEDLKNMCRATATNDASYCNLISSKTGKQNCIQFATQIATPQVI